MTPIEDRLQALMGRLDHQENRIQPGDKSLIWEGRMNYVRTKNKHAEFAPGCRSVTLEKTDYTADETLELWRELTMVLQIAWDSEPPLPLDCDFERGEKRPKDLPRKEKRL